MKRTNAVALVAVVALLGAVAAACQPGRVYTYRVATRGPVVSDPEQFASHVASTLADPRGWSLGGSIRYERTFGPADFTIWLSTAAAVPSFGSPCSSLWSCRSGPNVIINEDRWRSATPLWPYSVDAYRNYVVVHEVGHWLGLGHAGCPGFGQRAPVMVQQSKGGAVLGPCRFNVWPTEGERQAVAARHRVPAVPPDIPTPDDPFGSVDQLAVTRDEQGRPTSVTASGWVLDGDTTDPIRAVLVVDGSVAQLAPADRRRDDVAQVYPRFGPDHGYEVTAEVAPTAQVACVGAVGAGAGLAIQQLGCTVIK